MKNPPIKIGKGILEQIKENYNYSNTLTKESVKEAMMDLSTPSFCEFWKEQFNETYEEFIDKMLDIKKEEI